ncbi:hypothetical protein VP01_14178g1, partial [Puccinia sorghi]
QPQPHFQNQPPNHSTTATTNAMDLLEMKGRLSHSERVKMMQAGQCFQCRKVDFDRPNGEWQSSI